MTAERGAQDCRHRPASRPAGGRVRRRTRQARLAAPAPLPRTAKPARRAWTRRPTVAAIGSGTTASSSARKAIWAPAAGAKASACCPGRRWAEYKLPRRYLSRSPGASTGSNHAAHCRDWVRACKGGAPACSNFSIAGKYTEWLLLGAVAVHFEGKLLWDNAKGEVTNNKEANKLVSPLLSQGLGSQTLTVIL